MAIDPSKFHLINVADTCSVWNVLSSARLHAAAKEARCEFCITSFVRYECLIKPRKSPTPAEHELMRRLTQEQGRGGFAAHSCDIGDLQVIKILESRKRLGKGELSSIAFAMKIGQAVITDDKKARKLSEDSGHALRLDADFEGDRSNVVCETSAGDVGGIQRQRFHVHSSGPFGQPAPGPVETLQRRHRVERYRSHKQVRGNSRASLESRGSGRRR
ncbi:MAG: hypothetical protein P4L96_17690 [Rhodoferax sp.]|nr:hypothetical protein [Rhodoferax sp.]